MPTLNSAKCIFCENISHDMAVKNLNHDYENKYFSVNTLQDKFSDSIPNTHIWFCNICSPDHSMVFTNYVQLSTEDCNVLELNTAAVQFGEYRIWYHKDRSTLVIWGGNGIIQNSFNNIDFSSFEELEYKILNELMLS